VNQSTTTARAHLHAAQIGVIYGLAAYGSWAVAPLYFKAVAHVPAFEVLSHRVVWSLVLLLIVMLVSQNRRQLLPIFRSIRTLGFLLITATLLGIIWLTYIWAVMNDRVVEASLGYYINPLFYVLLGFVFLKERMRPWQIISVALAFVGVVYMTVMLGHLPWIALLLPFCFGIYGLLRKVAHIQPLAGLTVETIFMAPIAIVYLIILAARGSGTFGAVSIQMDGLLAFAGIMTAVPLIWFNHATRRLTLRTLGFIQYIAPTGQFLLGVLVYKEEFDRTHLIAFACIWTALIIYTIDTARHSRRREDTPTC